MLSLLNRPHHPWSLVPEVSDLNRLFQQAFSQSFSADVESVALNVYTGEDAAQVAVSVPGWQAEWFDLSVEGERLTLAGEAPGEEDSALKQFRRTVKLPFRVDPDQVAASYKSGILTVDLVKNEQDRARKIVINA